MRREPVVKKIIRFLGLDVHAETIAVAVVTIVAELGELSRFSHARQLMGYSGAVSREHSSGNEVRRGARGCPVRC